jgi:hypothetical protein
MFEDMAEKVAYNLQPKNREEFKAIFTKNLDINSLTVSIKKALINNFTADELCALSDFYGSEVGKSAMSKFGAYMAEVMPDIQAEMMKAQANANRELKTLNKNSDLTN